MNKIIFIFLICLFITSCSTNEITRGMAPLAPKSEAVTQSNKTETDLLLLVNKDHKLPDGYQPNLTEQGAKFDVIMAEDFGDMREAAKTEEVYLFIREAYRSHEAQQEIFDEIAADYIKQGYSRDEAAQKANQTAAFPGYSEHETGLAIDFSLANNAKETSKTWEWLSNNAYQYGFIQRYPEGKEEITGYSYEPWHYRYVGKEHAKKIFEQGLALEEYLNALT